jgi:tRNA-specific 2-thiouridylase
MVFDVNHGLNFDLSLPFGEESLKKLVNQFHHDLPSSARICVAMSGGVDSSTCAAVLKYAGYEVEGITLKLYESKVERDGACCSFRDIADAKRVAQQFDFPHFVLDYKEEFREKVIDDFISDYYSGRTPIPCVKCNQVIKFNYLFKLVKDLNFDYLVTGHYIRKIESGLYTATDSTKDQSYYLYNITSEQLKNLYFPLGNLDKLETRAIANFLNIKNSGKPDSQDICFVEDGSYRDFLKNITKQQVQNSGDIVDLSGKKLGVHDGVQNFTVGQRRGLGIQYPNPLYVIKIDAENKLVIVGEKKDLAKNFVKFSEISWVNIDKVFDGMVVSVRLRSMQKNVEAILFLQDSFCKVKLLTNQYFIAPGQACVVYNKDNLLGGGTIVESWFEEEDNV